VRVTQDGRYLFGTAAHINRVFVYALPEYRLVARIPQEKRPDLLWFTPDGKEAWITNRHAASVSVINVETLETVAVIPVGQNPHGIVIVP